MASYFGFLGFRNDFFQIVMVFRMIMLSITTICFTHLATSSLHVYLLLDIDDCPQEQDWQACGTGKCIDKINSFVCLCDDGIFRTSCVEAPGDLVGALSDSETIKSFTSAYVILAITAFAHYCLL